MPKVGDEEFAYTDKGIAQAKQKANATGESVDFSPGGSRDASQRSASREGYASGGTVQLPPLGPGVRWNFNQGPENAIEVPDIGGRTDEVSGVKPQVGPNTTNSISRFDTERVPGDNIPPGGREEDNLKDIGIAPYPPRPEHLPKREKLYPPSPVAHHADSYAKGGQVKQAGEPQDFTKGAQLIRERGKKVYEKGGKVSGVESTARTKADRDAENAGIKKPSWWAKADADVRAAYVKDKKRAKKNLGK